MGQYYKPIILEKRNQIKAWWYSHSYDNGLKLMEHSYIGNTLCNAVENYLTDNPQRIVWAGDYADEEPRSKSNLYHRTIGKNEVKDGNTSDLPAGMFVINHTKREYYARDEVKTYKVRFFDGTSDDYRINPLPLLTSEGNGRGGGDYHGEDPCNLIGSWARDEIEVSSHKPEDYKYLDMNKLGFSE